MSEAHKLNTDLITAVATNALSKQKKMREHREEIGSLTKELSNVEDMFEGTRAEEFKDTLRAIDGYLEMLDGALTKLAGNIAEVNVLAVKLDKAKAGDLETSEAAKKNKNKKIQDT